MRCLYGHPIVLLSAIVSFFGGGGGNGRGGDGGADAPRGVIAPRHPIYAIQNQYQMHMVWHHHKFTQFNVSRVVLYFIQNHIGQNSCARSLHLAIMDVPKIAFTVFGA
ncbi:MAG: hypothetical protein PHQ65_12475 [Bacteroidales bacterium]|nr:hypothetical protein [Bacteroidales bacterium]